MVMSYAPLGREGKVVRVIDLRITNSIDTLNDDTIQARVYAPELDEFASGGNLTFTESPTKIRQWGVTDVSFDGGDVFSITGRRDFDNATFIKGIKANVAAAVREARTLGGSCTRERINIQNISDDNQILPYISVVNGVTEQVQKATTVAAILRILRSNMLWIDGGVIKDLADYDTAIRVDAIIANRGLLPLDVSIAGARPPDAAVNKLFLTNHIIAGYQAKYGFESILPTPTSVAKETKLLNTDFRTLELAGDAIFGQALLDYQDSVSLDLTPWKLKVDDYNLTPGQPLRIPREGDLPDDDSFQIEAIIEDWTAREVRLVARPSISTELVRLVGAAIRRLVRSTRSSNA